MNDDGSNKVNPLLQAYADKALAEYKQALLSFLDKEIYFAGLDNDVTDTSDHWFAAKQYAFQIVRDFIETGLDYRK